MASFKCGICDYVYNEEKENKEFTALESSYSCPMCSGPKMLFKPYEEEEKVVIPEEIKLFNAIKIADDNVAIQRIKEKCIDCGLCAQVCKQREGINDICDGKACVNCGQCTISCPVGALVMKNDVYKFKEAKKQKKICIAYTSPSVRVAIGDELGMEKGTFAQGKLVSALKKLGFDYVLDVTFGADLTIAEEAAELVKRIKNNLTLPMFTSCCPAWVKYCEQYYPEILNNLSTCKSPIGMQGTIVKNYFTTKENIDSKNVFTVAITPCTAKKYEISRKEITGTDAVITTKELSDYIKEENIDFLSLPDMEFDALTGSGAGLIFGNTGGVMEAALRTAYKIMTGEELSLDKLNFKEVRGLENVKELTIDINGQMINVAVINQMSSALPILEDVKNGKSQYHYIEIMNCFGGCIGGGGQPKIKIQNEKEEKLKRINSLYEKDQDLAIRVSHKNPEVASVYNEYLEHPLSTKSEELLHTFYIDRSNDIK